MDVTSSMTMSDAERDECFKVIGGRDHNLLRLLSNKMNFKYKFLDPIQRTQGSASMSIDNLTFSGALGMIQKRVSQMSGVKKTRESIQYW